MMFQNKVVVESKMMRETDVYRESIKSIRDFRRLNARLFALPVGSLLSPSGHGGSTRVGSRSLAGRATILPMVVARFCCIGVGLSCGTGGAGSDGAVSP